MTHPIFVILALFIIPLLVIIIVSWFGPVDMLLQRDVLIGSIQCSGYIAAYFAVLMLELPLYKWVVRRDSLEEIKIKKALQKNIKKISGNWTTTAIYSKDGGEKHTIQGKCQITFEAGRAKIIGSSIDKEGNSRTWKAHSEYLSNQELTYIFDVPIEIGHSVLGMCHVSFSPGDTADCRVQKMIGSFGILSQSVLGKLVMERAD